MTLESWVDASAFGSVGHSDDELLKRLGQSSVQLPQEGMKFPVGRLKLVDGSPSGQSTRITKKLVLFKIVVGRSHVVDRANVARESLPEGYDSFFLPQCILNVFIILRVYG